MTVFNGGGLSGNGVGGGGRGGGGRGGDWGLRLDFAVGVGAALAVGGVLEELSGGLAVDKGGRLGGGAGGFEGGVDHGTGVACVGHRCLWGGGSRRGGGWRGRGSGWGGHGWRARGLHHLSAGFEAGLSAEGLQVGVDLLGRLACELATAEGAGFLVKWACVVHVEIHPAFEVRELGTANGGQGAFGLGVALEESSTHEDSAVGVSSGGGSTWGRMGRGATAPAKGLSSVPKLEGSA